MRSNVMRRDTLRPRHFRCNFTKALLWLLLTTGPKLAFAQESGFVGPWSRVENQSEFDIVPHNFDSSALAVSEKHDQALKVERVLSSLPSSAKVVLLFQKQR